MFSDLLSKLHFWGWQLIIVSARRSRCRWVISQSKEYAELEWPIDIAVAADRGSSSRSTSSAPWPGAANGTSTWPCGSTSPRSSPSRCCTSSTTSCPARPARSEELRRSTRGSRTPSCSWWYGHNAVGFLPDHAVPGADVLLPAKAANRPVFSYRLSILHFWSLVFIYIWAGPSPPALHAVARVGSRRWECCLLGHALDALVGAGCSTGC